MRGMCGPVERVVNQPIGLTAIFFDFPNPLKRMRFSVSHFNALKNVCVFSLGAVCCTIYPSSFMQ